MGSNAGPKVVAAACLALYSAACGQAFDTSPADAGRRDTGESSDSSGHGDVTQRETEPPTDAMSLDASAEVAPGDAAPCDGANLMTDKDHCGACWHSCQEGSCTNGLCDVTPLAMNLRNPDSLTADDAGNVYYSVLGTCDAKGLCMTANILTGAGKQFCPLALTTTLAHGLPVRTNASTVYFATSVVGGVVYSQGHAATTATPITPGFSTDAWSAIAVDDTNVYLGAVSGDLYYTGGSSWHTLAPPIGYAVTEISSFFGSGAPRAYWVSSAGKTIGGADFSMTPPSQISPVGTVKAPSSVAPASSRVAWLEADGIFSLDSMLSGAVTTIATPASAPWKAIADRTTGDLYWTSTGGGNVFVLRSGDTMPLLLATKQPAPTSIAIDSQKVYWINLGLLKGTGSVAWTWR